MSAVGLVLPHVIDALCATDDVLTVLVERIYQARAVVAADHDIAALRACHRAFRAAVAELRCFQGGEIG